jgi:hypothetical protein
MKTASVYHYFQAFGRSTQYLIGVWLGVFMFKTDLCQKFNKSLMFFGWFASLCFIIFQVYFRLRFFDWTHVVYNTIGRFLWACSISWIIFACHHLKSGGIIRKFLSHLYWQPISKLCLSIYLIHFVFISYVEMEKFQPVEGFRFPWIMLISAGDITISIFLAFFFHLFVEAPITNLIAFFTSLKRTIESDPSKTQHLKLSV